MESILKRSFIKRIILLVILVTLLQVIANYIDMFIKYDFYVLDFRSFYSAAQILINEPQNLYHFPTQATYQYQLWPDKYLDIHEQFLPFLNPPIFLIPFLLLTYLPIQSAYYVNSIGTIFIGLMSILFTAKLFDLQGKRLGLAIILSISFSPFYATTILGQSSFITLFIFSCVFYLLIKHHWFGSGIIASLLLYKPQLGIVLFLYLLSLRNRKILIGLFTGGIITLIISLILTQGHLLSMVYSIPEFINHYGTGPSSRISWLGFFHQLNKAISFLPVISLAIIISLATIIWSLKHIYPIKPSNNKFPIVYSIIIVTTLLSAIHIHTHEAVLLIFPFMYYFKNNSSGKFFLIVGISWLIFYLYIFNFLTPFYPQRMPFSPTIYLAILFYFLIRQLNLGQTSKNYHGFN